MCLSSLQGPAATAARRDQRRRSKKAATCHLETIFEDDLLLEDDVFGLVQEMTRSRSDGAPAKMRKSSKVMDLEEPASDKIVTIGKAEKEAQKKNDTTTTTTTIASAPAADKPRYGADLALALFSWFPVLILFFGAQEDRKVMVNIVVLLTLAFATTFRFIYLVACSSMGTQDEPVKAHSTA